MNHPAAAHATARNVHAVIWLVGRRTKALDLIVPAQALRLTGHNHEVDVVIVGAGAAGLATAIFTRRLNRGCVVVLLDGARRPGAKILVSGGNRCNVTNARVTEHDFYGGSAGAIRQVLRALPVSQTVAFFSEIGVPLHEEDHGKLFPDSNRSREVLNALLNESARVGVDRRDDHRVNGVERGQDGFTVHTSHGPITAARVVLATGGQSLPRSGSDGAGYRIAESLGHTIVPPVPALVPLLLDPAGPLDFAAMSGVSHDAEIVVWRDGRAADRLTGALLWTHFGISGPLALNVSRHWTRGEADSRPVQLTLGCLPGRTFEEADEAIRSAVAARPRASTHGVLEGWLPAAVARAVAACAGVDPALGVSSLERDARRRLAHALTALPLPVVGTRGYNVAEVTAGGVVLGEVSPRTMESRRCPGLFLTGEILDVDGRIGGFNFQWAWASAFTAARALSRDV
jgi:predicted Rossmann fold flavoprotein